MRTTCRNKKCKAALVTMNAARVMQREGAIYCASCRHLISRTATATTILLGVLYGIAKLALSLKGAP